MRCDPNPLGCGPCKQKSLPCVTTDRISGRPSERGHTERLEGEINALRLQLNAYINKYGPMEGLDTMPRQPSPLQPCQTFNMGTEYPNDTTQHDQMRLLTDFIHSPAVLSGQGGPHFGPIRGTTVDVLDQHIDVADFDCPGMDEPKQPLPNGRYQFNNSRSSFLSTIMGQVKPPAPELPDRDSAFTYAKYYLSVVAPYTPLLHGPSFLRLVMLLSFVSPIFTDLDRSRGCMSLVFGLRSLRM